MQLCSHCLPSKHALPRKPTQDSGPLFGHAGDCSVAAGCSLRQQFTSLNAEDWSLAHTSKGLLHTLLCDQAFNV